MVARVVVLDDDPTGTQCAADVDVALDPRPDALAAFDQRALYVLTNTRAVDSDSAARIVREVRDAFAHRSDAEAVFVLRGDSTLRGHVAAEMAALDLAEGVGLIVPAYPAAGRMTVGGVHYLDTGDGRVNVADTEFARDPVFGFRARTMSDWVREVGGPSDVATIGLAELRAGGSDTVAAALARAPQGSVVVPDAETDADITIVAGGLWQALHSGCMVVTRCAAPLAAAVAGTPGRLLSTGSVRVRRVLVVCGSHTGAATRQLERLTGDWLPVRSLPTASLLDAASGWTVGPLVASLRDDLARWGLAVIATERHRSEQHGTLDHAARVMDGLVRVVAEIAGDVDAVVSKGGITSAEVATRGLGGRSARVRGQVMTGVSLWDVKTASGWVVPQVVVPGNVGDDDTLVDVCSFLNSGGVTASLEVGKP